MGERRMGYLRFRRKLMLGYLVLCVLLASLLAWKMAVGYRADHDAAAMVAKNSAVAMAAHVDDLIDAVDQTLQSSALAISAMPSDATSPEAVQTMLAAASQASDSRFWLIFIDPAGRAVASSNDSPIRGVSFADRSYFVQAAAAQNDHPHLGPPQIDGFFKRRLFVLSRQVVSKSGRFLGVIVAPVDASKVADLFNKARLSTAMSIALITRAHAIVARAPLFEESFGAQLFEFTLPDSSQVFEARSPFRGERRLFASAAVGDLPLLVVVGLTRESWMAGFRSDFMAGLIGLAVALTVALFCGKFALEQFERLEHVEAWQRKLIDELGAAKEALSREERRLRVIAERTPAHIAYVDAQERYTFHNASLLGVPLGGALGKTLLETFGPHIYALLKADIDSALVGNVVCVERHYLVGGEERHFKHEYTPDFSEDGRVVGFYAMVTDITDLKRVQQKLLECARVDALTGLPNRVGLLERLETALARSRRSGEALACLYLDIDRFKEVNDTLGHSGGDCALVEFSHRLRQCVRESDLVGRLAGDEFVIVLHDLDQARDAQCVAEKIIASMAVPFNIEGRHWHVTTSIGLVCACAVHEDAHSILQDADGALYQAKRAGRNRIAVWERADVVAESGREITRYD